MDRLFTLAANAIAGFVGNPLAFVIALGTVIVWGVTGPVFGYSDTWQLVINTGTTIITFLIVFLIQNSQNRDAAAIQAKLDEVIRTLDGARNAFIGIEHLTEKQLRAILVALEKECDETEEGDRDASHATVARLLQRT
jgi:low affinity Fe/Cu permease